MSNKFTILVICQHNSGRSQIAEAYLNKFYGDHVLVECAGLEPAQAVNPLVIRAMAEEGSDLSGKKPQSVFELFKQEKLYAYVITVCQDFEKNVRYFRVSRNVGTGLFQIRRRSRESRRKSSQRCESFAI